MPRDLEYYLSADSAPKGYADRRSWWVAPSFLGCIAVSGVAAAESVKSLTRPYAEIVGALSGAPTQNLLRNGGSVSFRPLLLVTIMVYILWSSGGAARRVIAALRSGLVYLCACIGVDTLLASNVGLRFPSPLTPRGTVIAVVAGVLVIAIVVLTSYELPNGVVVHRERKPAVGPRRVFTLVMCLSILVTAATWSYRQELLRRSHVPLLGGFAATIVVFLFVLQLGLYIAAVLRRPHPPPPGDPLSVGVIIPAYNEEYSISAVLEALDESAARYPGAVYVTVINNASKDQTAERSRATFATCQHVIGDVIDCPTPGKSYALNLGLAQTAEDVVVRVDADTIVEPSLFERVIPYFHDDTVGGVSGIPLPRSDARRVLYGIRYLEVLYSVGFLRVAQGSADATVVMPGNMSAYRGDVVRRLGFGVGFNGEDTDIAVRIGRAGYQVITDLRVRFYPEVPASIAQLREQRQRWSRGILHVAGRNVSAIRMHQGVRGVWSLPWAIVSTCRRAFTIPVFTGAAAFAAVSPGVLTLRQVALFGGIVMGVHTFTLICLACGHRAWRLLPYIPAYLAFRVFKLYVALESILSLRVRASAPEPASDMSTSPSPTGLALESETSAV
jgi:cellulose synthase/poly-beta-1,6-N-acetylglucosamine synthase-like glycosyltransferase